MKIVKKIAPTVLILTLTLANVVAVLANANENATQDIKNEIIYDGDITYHELKEIVVENFLYTLDLALHHRSIQEAENIYETSSYAELEKYIDIAEDRLNSITGKENELQIVECLHMQMDLARSISYLIVK